MKESQTNSLTNVFFKILITASNLWGDKALIELIYFLYSTDFSFCFFLLSSLTNLTLMNIVSIATQFHSVSSSTCSP